jgi:hypothetical protein
VKKPLSRRRFLKYGIAGGATLLFATVAANWFLDRTGREPLTSHGYRVLRQRDLLVLLALIPAVLPAAPSSEKVLLDIDTFLATQTHQTRQDFYKLLDAMSFTPTRILLFGVWGSWISLDQNDASRFMDQLRTSRLLMRRSIYNSLIQTVAMPWYADSDSWATIGYPGPPPV